MVLMYFRVEKVYNWKFHILQNEEGAALVAAMSFYEHNSSIEQLDQVWCYRSTMIFYVLYIMIAIFFTAHCTYGI